jgi:hypothetical protein
MRRRVREDSPGRATGSGSGGTLSAANGIVEKIGDRLEQ